MSASDDACFIDTNILVYSWSEQSNKKGAVARKIIQQSLETGRGVISLQVLQEFYSVVTTRLGADKLTAKELVSGFANLKVVEPDLEMLQQAIDISILSRISFWDGMIVAAACRANCAVLYSEDMNAGQSIRGITIINPFN
jgi:predicted nucleic acid-binding protein